MENRYELIIKVQNNGESNDNLTAIPNSGNGNNNQPKVAGQDRLQQFAQNAAKGIAINSFRQVVTAGVSMVGSQHLQDQVNFAMSIGQTIANIALLGSSFGPIGVAIGVIQSLINFGIKTYQYDYNSRLDDISLGIAQQRAGLQFNQSRRDGV